MPIYIGTQKIDMSGIEKVYVGTQLVYQKNVPIVLENITLSGFTTSYNTYATFTFTGTVTAHYSDGTTANVTSACTHTTPNMTSAGTKSVTVTYTENGVTVTANYNITVSKAWRTIYDNSSGTRILKYNQSSATSAGTWTTETLPGNISNYAEQIRVNYTTNWGGSISSANFKWNKTIDDTSKRTKYTRTFNYTQGNDIVYVSLTGSNRTTNASWYKNGLWTGTGITIMAGGYGNITIFKLEQYY